MVARTTGDFRLDHAIAIIQKEFGDKVSIQEKDEDLLKFGRNQSVTTTESTIMTLPAGINNETYVSDNLITHISSADSGDTQDIVIKGDTISGGVFTEVTQTVTLVGQTKTPLTTPLARAERAYNENSSNLTGPVYIYEDGDLTAGVPDTGSEVHLMIRGGKNQTEKAAATTPNDTYWILTKFYGDILAKASAFSEIELQVRRAGKVFREVAAFGISEKHSHDLRFDPYYIVPKNADIRLIGISDNAGGRDVSGGIQGYLAKVVT